MEDHALVTSSYQSWILALFLRYKSDDCVFNTLAKCTLLLSVWKQWFHYAFDASADQALLKAESTLQQIAASGGWQPTTEPKPSRKGDCHS